VHHTLHVAGSAQNRQQLFDGIAAMENDWQLMLLGEFQVHF
jgi:hypothetical protein